MIRRFIASFIVAIFIAPTAYASEAISSGKIQNFSYRGGHVLFQVKNGSTNDCQQCAAEVSGYAAGGYCWVDKEEKTLISIVLAAYTSGKSVLGRVSSWEQCRLYQFNIVN